MWLRRGAGSGQQRALTPEGSAVVVNGLRVATDVFQEVGIVVVDFGIVRQSLDAGAETRRMRREMRRRRRHEGMRWRQPRKEKKIT